MAVTAKRALQLSSKLRTIMIVTILADLDNDSWYIGIITKKDELKKEAITCQIMT